jgi:hypothetical protein
MSQNCRFQGEAPADPECDHPPGLSIVKYLKESVQGLGWSVPEFDNWRDVGWSIVCAKGGGKVQVAFTRIEDGEWMLQVAPEYVPGLIAGLFGKLPSAQPKDCLSLARAVDQALRRHGSYSGFRWCWDGSPDELTSTSEPEEFRPGSARKDG